MGLRVRWTFVAKSAAILAGLLLAIQLVPELLKPPPPEPLPADVGLPRVKVDRSPIRNLGREAAGRWPMRRAESAEGKPRSRHPVDPGPRSRAERKQGPSPRRQDPPAATPEPEPAPEPSPPPPPPPPPPLDDGSMEFAPR